jgi:hypothetical protein
MWGFRRSRTLNPKLPDPTAEPKRSAELGGANGGNLRYKTALQNLDSDMPQYITDNTDDEISHAAFLNAYLMSRGAQPVNLDMFKSKALGLTNDLAQTNLILPEPCQFLSTGLPDCSVIRPISTKLSGAVAAAHAFADDKLIQPDLFSFMLGLATAADAAERQ